MIIKSPRLILHRLAAFVVLAAVDCQLAVVFAQGTAFTYQGRLNQNSTPANGLYDFQFAIYDASTQGQAVASTVSVTAAAVSNGLFTATLDFGSGVFTGPARWLEISVRTNGTGTYSLLQPRQQVAPSPYALFAPMAGTAQTVPAGSITASQLATNAVGETALSSNLLAKVNAFLIWQTQTLPVVTSSNTVTTPAGYPFDFQVTATNFSPFFFYASGLPPGLSFDAFDTFAEISGICNSTGSFPVALQIGNVAGTIGTNLLLSFSPSPPTLDFQDLQTNYSRYLHGNVEIDALAYGFPLSYQWLQNGALLAGISGTNLVLTNLTWTNAGTYTIVATNYLGSARADIDLNVNNLAAWGAFADGSDVKDTAPATLTNVIAAANNDGILALTADGRIFRWDENGADPVLRLTNLVSVAAGLAHSLALSNNGTVYAWGDDSLGQTDVPPKATNVWAIAANGYVSAALKADGTVVMWGDDENNEFTPPSNATNLFAFAKGDSHSLGLRGDGTVVAWRDNTYGQTNVPTGLSGVVAIAAGVTHSLALLTNGMVTGWGDPGALNIPAGLTNVVSIAAGDSVSLALMADGTWTWWGDTNFWSPDEFPADLAHAAALYTSLDSFSAIINDTKSFVFNGKVSTSFSYQILPASKSKYFALGLPPGLSVNTSSGLVSGTPSKVGNWSVFLGTRNAVTNAAQVLYFRISP